MVGHCTLAVPVIIIGGVTRDVTVPIALELFYCPTIDRGWCLRATDPAQKTPGLSPLPTCHRMALPGLVSLLLSLWRGRGVEISHCSMLTPPALPARGGGAAAYHSRDTGAGTSALLATVTVPYTWKLRCFVPCPGPGCSTASQLHTVSQPQTVGLS